MAEPAFHVSGVVVTCRPEHMTRVVAAIGGVPGAEVHAAEAGRIVVVIEGEDAGALADAMNRITRLPHVYSAALVSHHVDDGEEAEETPATAPSPVAPGRAQQPGEA